MTTIKFATGVAGIFLMVAIVPPALADGIKIHGKAQSDFYSLSANLRHSAREVLHTSPSSVGSNTADPERKAHEQHQHSKARAQLDDAGNHG